VKKHKLPTVPVAEPISVITGLGEETPLTEVTQLGLIMADGQYRQKVHAYVLPGDAPHP